MRELRESVEDMKIKIETYVAEKRNITANFESRKRPTRNIYRKGGRKPNSSERKRKKQRMLKK